MREGNPVTIMDKTRSEDVLRQSQKSLDRMSTLTALKSYREKIVRELVETEQTYVKNLNNLIEVS